MTDIVIASAARTPVGSFNGSLSSSLSAAELGVVAIAGGPRSGPRSSADEVDEVILGQVLQAGAGPGSGPPGGGQGGGAGSRAPAWSPEPDLRVRACAPSPSAYQQIKAMGDAGIVIAGGQESMSQAPHCRPPAQRPEDGRPLQFVDTMIKDGLWDAFNGYHMGQTAENIATRWQITREDQDRFAVASQNKAEKARGAEGRFNDEIAPVTIKGRKGDTVVDQDEYIRNGATYESDRRG